jgi:hypothetical protein
MHQSFTQTHMGLQAHAESLGVQTIDLSCTGLALLLNCETGHGVVGQVGDGVLLGLTRQGKIQPLVEAQKGPEPLSTYTISHATFLEHLAVAAIKPSSVDPWQSFYLMTDGLANDLLHAPRSAGLVFWAQQVRRKLSRASQVAEAATQLLHWLSTYQVTGSFDDRTLVVVTQREDVQARHQRAANPPA